MQPNNQNSYDFILDQQQRNGGPSFGNKKRQTILGVLFVAIALIIVGIVASVIFSGGGAANDGLVSLNAQQTEINRVITLGQKNLDSPEIKQQLGTLQTAIISDQKQLSALLSARGVKVTKTQLSSKKDSTTDTALADAVKSGNHDDVLLESVQTSVQKYYAALTSAKTAASTNKEKSIINTAMANVETVFKN